PYTNKPRLIAYLNRGNLQFEKMVISEGLGTHEGKIAPKPYQGSLLFYANSTTQPWFDGMVTTLTTWTIQAAGQPTSELLFRDTFDGKLDAGWEWLREKAGAWQSGNHELRL